MAPKTVDKSERDAAYREFKAAVNMNRKRLEKWLDSDESKGTGLTKSGAKKTGRSGGGESTGHASGRAIVTILGKKKSELTAADVKQMRRVAGYVKRHRKQRPDKGKRALASSRWRYSLMNWGHDPLRD